jgi:hypothetical protein
MCLTHPKGVSVPGPPSSMDLLAVVDSLRSELAEVRARLNKVE